mmetsp:Transcript_11656/g.19865  ORF Transcript_11656/g.19865 Transcript_11656/m.19865 type:complete len:285 (+) Transcript_11656:170-1024(+)
MEAIDGLNELPGLTSLTDPLVHDGADGTVGVSHVKVLVVVVLDDLEVRETEVEGTVARLVAPVAVRVEPSPAGRDLKTVEIVVEISIGDVVSELADGVDSVVHGIPQNSSLSQTHKDHEGTLGKDSVEVVHGCHDVGVKLLRGGHVTKARVSVADVIAHEGILEDDGKVVELVTMEAIHDAVGHGAGASTIDTNVLVITVSAEIPLADVLVGAEHGAAGMAGPVVVSVARSGAHHGPVKLVGEDVDEIVVSGGGDVCGCDVLGRGVKVRGGTVSEDGRSVLRSS